MFVFNKEIKITGRLIKTVQLKEEWDEDIENPEEFIRELKRNRIKGDIFTFCQRLPKSKPEFNYHIEWDSIAAVPIGSYENWIKNQIATNSRNKIKLAVKKDILIKPCEFDDEMVKRILDIYHDTPVMQGAPNLQYNTDFETAKKLNSTFLDRANFFAAFYKNECIGYIKLVYTFKYMRTMGILSKAAYQKLGVMNLLMAKAVEYCSEKQIPYLMYARYNYGKRGSETLKDFKRHMGFESIILPRYYIPLNTWGKIIIKLKLFNDPKEFLPERLIRFLLKLRKSWYEFKYRDLLETSDIKTEKSS
jgi:hypothetical protein